jgi:hypothetical protein
MGRLVGYGVSQVPTNGMLGGMAYQDPTNVTVNNISVGSNISVSGIVTVAAGSTASPSISPSGDNNTGIFFPSPDTIAFGEGGVEGFRLDSSGRLLVGTTSATANGGVLELSGGITFPATAVAASNANTLDDYEEGTWTATLQEFPAGGTTTATGRYTKTGRYVHIQVRFLNVNLSTWTGNAAYITGAPFTSAEETVGSLMTDSFTFEATGTSLNAWIEAGTQINLYASQTNATKKSVKISPGTGRNLWLNLLYSV